MPIISIFFGIVIRINFEDHPPPHIHAQYQGQEALIAIRTGDVLRGRLPARVLRLVQDWVVENQAALMQNWDRAAARQDVFRIPGADQ